MKRNIILMILFFTVKLTFAETIIDQPGDYVLGSDVSGSKLPIHITVDNVTLNLNGNRLLDSDTAVLIDSSLSHINVLNGLITNMTSTGILVQDGCSSVLISDLDISLCGRIGIYLSGDTIGISKVTIKNNIIYNSGQTLDIPFDGVLTCINCDQCTISNCIISQNSNDLVDFAPLSLQQFNNGLLENVRVENNFAAESITSFFFFDGTKTTFRDCVALSNTIDGAGAGTFAYGFLFSPDVVMNTNSSLFNCLAQGMSGASTVAGFSMGSQNNVLFSGCQSLQNTGTDTVYGFWFANGAVQSTLENCLAQGNTANVITGTAAGIRFFNAELCNITQCLCYDQVGNVGVGVDINTCFTCDIDNSTADGNLGTNDASSFGFRINDGDPLNPDVGLNHFVHNLASNNGATAANQMSNFIVGTATNITYATLNTVTAPFTNLGIVG